MGAIEEDIVSLIKQRDELKRKVEQLTLMLDVATKLHNRLIKEREQCNADAARKRLI